MKNTVIANMAAGGKKVEIYQGGDRPVKTWIVGTSTPNHAGTFMVLEQNGQRSQDPLRDPHGRELWLSLPPLFHLRKRMASHGRFQFFGSRKDPIRLFRKSRGSYALQLSTMAS